MLIFVKKRKERKKNPLLLAYLNSMLLLLIIISISFVKIRSEGRCPLKVLIEHKNAFTNNNLVRFAFVFVT